MLTPHQRVVYAYLNKWRNLKAWGRSLDKLDLTVSTREYPKRAGTCWPALQKVNVYHQSGIVGALGMLKTGLHEFAHAIEGEDGHGFKWQARYAKAVTEVTNIYVGWNYQTPKEIDRQCYIAMGRWWRNGPEADAKRTGI